MVRNEELRLLDRELELAHLRNVGENGINPSYACKNGSVVETLSKLEQVSQDRMAGRVGLLEGRALAGFIRPAKGRLERRMWRAKRPIDEIAQEIDNYSQVHVTRSETKQKCFGELVATSNQFVLAGVSPAHRSANYLDAFDLRALSPLIAKSIDTPFELDERRSILRGQDLVDAFPTDSLSRASRSQMGSEVLVEKRAAFRLVQSYRGDISEKVAFELPGYDMRFSQVLYDKLLDDTLHILSTNDGRIYFGLRVTLGPQSPYDVFVNTYFGRHKKERPTPVVVVELAAFLELTTEARSLASIAYTEQ